MDIHTCLFVDMTDLLTVQTHKRWYDALVCCQWSLQETSQKKQKPRNYWDFYLWRFQGFRLTSPKNDHFRTFEFAHPKEWRKPGSIKLQYLKSKAFGLKRHLTVFTSLLQCHETAYLAAIVLMKEFLAWPITLWHVYGLHNQLLVSKYNPSFTSEN